MSLIDDIRTDIGDDDGIAASGSVAAQHNLLSSTHADTLTAGAGDQRIMRSNGGSWGALDAGGEGALLAILSGDVSWILDNPSTGDVVYYTAAGWQKLSIGADGQFLKVDSGVPVWETVLALPASGTGEIKTGSYVTLSYDKEYYPINTAGSTVVLPQNPTDWQTHTVKDNSGAAGSSAITIRGSGDNIDGSTSAQIGSNYGALKFVYNGSRWNIV